MKKFKTNKAIESFKNDSLIKEQMYRLTGGASLIRIGTGATKSVKHIDGKDDRNTDSEPILIVKKTS